jgi:hypothetical protein
VHGRLDEHGLGCTNREVKGYCSKSARHANQEREAEEKLSLVGANPPKPRPPSPAKIKKA